MGSELSCEKTNQKIQEKSSIQTFVFFDLETTGLFNEPRILELALAAISRQALLNTHSEESKQLLVHYGDNQTYVGKSKAPPLPRVLHKLVQLYYPRRIIPHAVEDITGLSNDLICELPQFTDTSATVISNFLKSLPAPICLVAHNGLRYDFPILRAELQNINKFEEFQNYFCIDSLLCFRQLDQQDLSEPSCSENSEDPITPSPTAPLKGLPIPKFETPEKQIQIVHMPDTPVKRQQIEEKTTPVKNGKIIKRNPARKAKRKLYFDSEKKPSYKQIDIFTRLFSENYDAHSAEADALALMKICIQYHEHFVRWADQNTKTLSDVEPKWTRVKKKHHSIT